MASFEPHALVRRRQIFNILRDVNRRRKKAGYEMVPNSAIWLKNWADRPLITFLLFLKMADEQTRPPSNSPPNLPRQVRLGEPADATAGDPWYNRGNKETAAEGEKACPPQSRLKKLNCR